MTTATTSATSSRQQQKQKQHQHEQQQHSPDGFYYLTPQAREQLPQYQYKGRDDSLLYKYILSPFAGWCVETLTPRWIAPNTITLIGLLWMVSSYLLFWYYVPDMNNDDNDSDNEPPRWIYVFNVLAMLGYQSLDNMDGKQARRTKSSSPLGLLFDHGCDAINPTLIAANFIIALGLSPSRIINNNDNDNGSDHGSDMIHMFIAMFGPISVFYQCTLQQYYTGELILVMINGVNEGIWIVSVLQLLSFWYGPSIWSGTEVYDLLFSESAIVSSSFLPPVLRNSDIIMAIYAFLCTKEYLEGIIPILQKYPGSFQTLLPMHVLLACCVIIGWVTPEVWANMPRTSLHLLGILFNDMVIDLMVAHVTAQPYSVKNRWTLYPLVCLTGWVVAFGYSTPSIDYWVLAYASSVGAYFSMKVVLLIHEVCNTLGIWCFDIITPHPNNNNNNNNNNFVDSNSIVVSNGNGHAKVQ